tara:strand:- start:2615 stop:2782 length:168 start_codon:yes stop_codon:yes gene_type:complete
MAFYVCKIKNSDEVVWKLKATCLENAVIKFAAIKNLELNEYKKLFDTEEEKYESR